MGREHYDVVVVGASIAGSAAARLLARAGARVALAERRPDPAAYKLACTHQIQPSAQPAIERLGLGPALERAGTARARPAVWTPHGGWARFPRDAPRSFGITRERLDPIVRELALATPGVEALLGERAVGVLRDGERVAGVELEDRAGRRRRLRAPLTVAADGRDSSLARLAGVPARLLPHNRFVFFAYWRGVETPADEARVWLLDPDAGAVFPNEDGITLIAVVPLRPQLDEFRADLEAAYLRRVRALPDGPGLEGAERISKLIGKIEATNKMRPAARPGLAFVGDAAIAADPLFGVGCGWAFQSAEWLAEEAAGAVLGGGELDSALRRYRRAVIRRLGPHHLQIASYSTGRPFRIDERITFRAATRDPVVGAALEEVATRRRSPLRFLDPGLTARSLRAGARPLLLTQRLGEDRV